MLPSTYTIEYCTQQKKKLNIKNKGEGTVFQTVKPKFGKKKKKLSW